jgi:flagellar protein FlaF
LEANLLSKSAARFQRIQDNWESQKHDLGAALFQNRKLWTVFLETSINEENPLPEAIRQNIANLALFVMKQTVSAQAGPTPGKLDVLININREVAAGLRAK